MIEIRSTIEFIGGQCPSNRMVEGTFVTHAARDENSNRVSNSCLQPRWSFALVWVIVLTVLFMPSSASAVAVSPPEFPTLVNDADYIVRAKIKSVHSEWSHESQRPKIYTYVELEVLETIAGNPPQPLVLRLLGGKVGDQEMILEGGPEFAPGEEHVLFVQGNGRLIVPLVAVMHGDYLVERDEANGTAMMLRSDHQPLRHESDVIQPLHQDSHLEEAAAASLPPAMTPEEFAARIRAVRKPRSNHEAIP